MPGTSLEFMYHLLSVSVEVLPATDEGWQLRKRERKTSTDLVHYWPWKLIAPGSPIISSYAAQKEESFDPQHRHTQNTSWAGPSKEGMLSLCFQMPKECAISELAGLWAQDSQKGAHLCYCSASVTHASASLAGKARFRTTVQPVLIPDSIWLHWYWDDAS